MEMVKRCMVGLERGAYSLTSSAMGALEQETPCASHPRSGSATRRIAAATAEGHERKRTADRNGDTTPTSAPEHPSLRHAQERPSSAAGDPADGCENLATPQLTTFERTESSATRCAGPGAGGEVTSARRLSRGGMPVVQVRHVRVGVHQRVVRVTMPDTISNRTLSAQE